MGGKEGRREEVDGWMDGWMDGCMYVCMRMGDDNSIAV